MFIQNLYKNRNAHFRKQINLSVTSWGLKAQYQDCKPQQMCPFIPKFVSKTGQWRTQKGHKQPDTGNRPAHGLGVLLRFSRCHSRSLCPDNGTTQGMPMLWRRCAANPYPTRSLAHGSWLGLAQAQQHAALRIKHQSAFYKRQPRLHIWRGLLQPPD